MSFQRLEAIELDHVDSVSPPRLGHLENADGASQEQHRTPTTNGILVRRPKPLCVLLKRLPTWLVTAGVVGGIFCVLIFYSKKPVMSKTSERWFNVWITGLSIALGLAISSSLNGVVSDLRWRILSRRYRSRRKIEHILKADSMLDLIRLECRSRRPTIHAAVMSWIILLLVRNGPSPSTALLTVGQSRSLRLPLPRWASATLRKTLKGKPFQCLEMSSSQICHPCRQTRSFQTLLQMLVGNSTFLISMVYLRTLATRSILTFNLHSYGIVSSAYPIGGIQDLPSSGTIYIEGDALIYAADLWRYVFRETSVKSMRTDDTKPLAVVSSRSISTGAACRSWRVVQGGNGSQPIIVVAMEQGDTRIDLPLAGGTNQTTYMINTTQSCGPGCS